MFKSTDETSSIMNRCIT